MPNIASIGWAYVSGSTVANVSYNASTLDRETIIPEGYYCLLYGPVTVGAAGSLKIEADAIVKIQPFADV